MAVPRTGGLASVSGGAAQGAERLLRNVEVRHEIARLQAEIAHKLEVSAQEVTKRLKQLAFFDIRKLYNEDGSLKRMVDLDDDTAAAIRWVQVDKLFAHFGKGAAEQIGTTTKIKLCDSGMNCERLGRHIPGFFRDKFEVEVKVDLYERIAAGRRRVAEAAARQWSNLRKNQPNQTMTQPLRIAPMAAEAQVLPPEATLADEISFLADADLVNKCYGFGHPSN